MKRAHTYGNHKSAKLNNANESALHLYMKSLIARVLRVYSLQVARLDLGNALDLLTSCLAFFLLQSGV